MFPPPLRSLLFLGTSKLSPPDCWSDFLACRPDCVHAMVEVLPDGTFACTTYGYWTQGEQPWILSVRFRLDELDLRLP